MNISISGHAAVVTVKAPEPFFKLDLSPLFPERQFATLDDLRAWLLQEQQFFGFIASDPQWRQMGTPFAEASGQVDIYKPALDRLVQMEAAKDNPDVMASHLRKLHAHLRGNFVDQKYLLSNDPRADMLARLWREGLPTPRTAAWTMFAFMGRSGNMNDPQVFEGASRAMFFKFGMSETAESATTTLTTLHTEYQKRLDTLDARRRELATATETATTSATESAAQRATAFDTAQAERTAESERLRTEAESAFDQQRKAYNEHMALQAPVTYWSKKATRHAYCGAGFGVLSLLFLGGYILLAVHYLPVFIGMLRGVVEAAAGAPTGGTAAVAAAPAASAHTQAVPVYVALFAVALIGIWVMRILVRLTLSHIHLGTDAKHRSVCVQSYLALLSMEKDAVGPDERQIILTQLFRPTSDGLVRDDAMPPTLFERITSPR